jgi:alkylhydroperoxidase family enzyme
MVRIAPVPSRWASFLLRLLNAVARRTVGLELNPLDAADERPDFVLPSLATDRVVRGRAELDPEVRTLATRLVATINGRCWDLDGGRLAGRRAGVASDKLVAVADHATDPRFTPDERAALAYAAVVTEVAARVPDELVAELRRHFSQRDIVELTLAVARENVDNRIVARRPVEARGLRIASSPAAEARPKRPSYRRRRGRSPGSRRLRHGRLIFHTRAY